MSTRCNEDDVWMKLVTHYCLIHSSLQPSTVKPKMSRSTRAHVLLFGKTIKFSALVAFVLLSAKVAEAKQSIKSIKSKDGDIIDCIDIHKQPTFSHPLLKNHTIEMKPRYLPPHKATNKASSAATQQVWHKSGNCPNGTIPIRRTKRKHKLTLEGEQPTRCQSEVAGIQTKETMYGARADINVWNVSVEANEWSLSSISIFNGQGSFIQYGWMASPALYDDDGQTRLFISWDRPGPGRHGCFNLECPGFVQVTDRLALGATLAPTSERGGSQFEAQLAVYEDGSSGKWWALYGQVVVGYWPAEALGQTAAAFQAGARATWGGEVCGGGPRTTTQMGSGRSPIDDVKDSSWGRTAYVHGMEAMDRDGRWRRPQDVAYGVSSPDCYQAMIYEPGDGKLSAYYGGPGDECFDATRL